MKERIFVLGLFLLVSFFLVDMTKGTYSYSYDIDKAVLFYNDDTEKLENDIKEYIGVIDNYLISNSSFDMSYYLNENYDFLVNFAIDYILGNIEYYHENIVIIDNENYIDIENIYNITDKYFGVRDFYILNSNVNGEYIQLINYNELEFNLSIVDVVVVSNSSEIVASVLYENNVKYNYLFDNVNGVLKIKNIEVL